MVEEYGSSSGKGFRRTLLAVLGTAHTKIRVTMDKRAFKEADIRTKLITPAIAGEGGSKWSVFSQMMEVCYITKVRVFVLKAHR